MDGSDDQALAKARAGDREGFRLLVERHSRALFRLAHRMTGNEHDAEDVVQEAFLRAYKRLDQFEDRSQVGSWLFRIAANCAYDLLRSRQRRDRHLDHEGDDRVDAMAAADAGPDRLAAGSDVRRGVEAAMHEMSDRERSAFALRHFEGWSIAEIAGALGLDESATKQSIFRAVRKARGALAPLLGGVAVSHLREDDLTLHYYREDGGAAAAHLAECADCAAAYAALAADLDTLAPPPVPERPDGFEARMWERVEAKLPKTRSRWAPWAGGLAIAASLVLAFWLGRQTNVSAPASLAPTQEQVRERVLFVAVGDHLERSQMVLLEVMNAPAGDAAGLASSQRSAEDLATANRLYRQAAVRAGEPAVASVLEDLERTLVEIANSPSPASSTQVERLRQRIESKGLLLKVRVIGSHLREKEKEVARGTRS